MTTTPPLRFALRGIGLLLAILWGFSLVRPPAGTSAGLDQSWRIALTLAAEQHLRFGQDIVFSFGPLGYALQGIPDPALAPSSALIGGLLAALTVAGVVTALSGRGGLPLKLAFAGTVVSLATVLTLDYVAAIGALALVVRAARFPRAAPAAGIALGALALIGLLSKYTLGVDVLAAATAAFAVDALRRPRRRRRAALFALAGCWAIAVAGLLAAFGGSPPALAAYLRGATEIANGYSAGLALAGPAVELAAALAVGGCILVLCGAAARERKLGAAAAAAAVLILAWKHGFVRQDGHIIYYFGTAAAIAPLLGMTLRRRVAATFAVATSVLALGAYGWAQSRVFSPLPAVFEPARMGQGIAFVLHPVRTAADRAAVIRAQLAPDRLPPSVVAQLGTARVDVLPIETAIVEENALRWAPLPVFQTYSAYTPYLDALDREALVAHGADYELYRYEAIDDRYPFADAPATFAELACRYTVAVPNVLTGGRVPFTLLRRVPRAHCDDAPAGSTVAALNAAFAVPPAGAPDAFVVASFTLRPTLATRVRTAALRAPRVDLAVRFADGTRQQHRVVAATLGDGMIVSASPRDGAEAVRFFAGQSVAAVREITVLARPGSYVLERVTFTRRSRRR